MWQKVKNIYHGLVALLANIYYGFPSKKLKIIGVTGTDGKTTTVHLIHHILQQDRRRCSMISSIYAQIGGKKHHTGFHVTTPDPWQVQKLLRMAVDAGDEYMVLEVTSHGLDQNRVWGISFDLGVLTNITHEHLDYHRTYQNYVKAKLKLLNLSQTAIINKDDRSYSFSDISIYRKKVTYGIEKEADVTPKKFPFTTLLPGKFNQYNCLAAIAATKQLGISDTNIRLAINGFTGIKGRFEHINIGKNYNVIIDFAHTPNALEQVLSTVKPQIKGKLIHVFGSAGLRDKKKRSLMGQTSSKYADFIVLTEEDYRTEDVHKIIGEIARGCKKNGAKELETIKFKPIQKYSSPVFFKIPDRQRAINFAIGKLAQAKDTIILTGKAHEKSLCRGKIEHPWDEEKAVKKALN